MFSLFSRFLSFLARTHAVPIPGSVQNSARRKFSRRERGQLVDFTARPGFRIQCRIGDPLDNLVYFEGEFEPELRLLLQQLALSPTTFVDVGCNIGYVSCLVAKLAPCARIISLDANPEMIRRCEANLQLNGRKPETLCCAAGSSRETRTFHIPRDRPSYASFGALNHESVSVEIPVRRLDELLHEKGLASVDLLKIDVEGFEPAVLEGLGAIPVKNIFFEFSPGNLRNCGFRPRDLWDLPLWKNYRLFLLERETGRPIPYRPGAEIHNATDIAWATLP